MGSRSCYPSTSIRFLHANVMTCMSKIFKSNSSKHILLTELLKSISASTVFSGIRVDFTTWILCYQLISCSHSLVTWFQDLFQLMLLWFCSCPQCADNTSGSSKGSVNSAVCDNTLYISQILCYSIFLWAAYPPWSPEVIASLHYGYACYSTSSWNPWSLASILEVLLMQVS